MLDLKPFALSALMLLVGQAGTSTAQGPGPDVGDVAQSAGDVQSDEVANGPSSCSCPRFMCGKVPQGACSTSCEPPQAAKCVCGSCVDYHRQNTCACE